MSISSWFDPISAGLTLLAGLLLPGAKGGDPAPRVLDDEARGEVLERILEELEHGYVFPEVAKRMEEDVRTRITRGEYASLTDREAFARTLTQHLQSVSRDKHLRVVVRDDAGPREPSPAERDEMRARHAAEAAWQNYGFERVERLAGNVGYLELRAFEPADLAAATATAAWTFLANTDALIVDLRQNGGGEPNMVARMCSHLFGPEPVHLNDLYFRPEDKTEEFWTLRELEGPRYLDKPVFVLTSARTFSAAEEFAYNLQSLRRATIVGETTGGGAHPGDLRPLGHGLAAFVPNGRAINPITKTNWEGTGVVPEVAAPAQEALATAHALALDALIATRPDSDPRRTKLADLRARLAQDPQPRR